MTFSQLNLLPRQSSGTNGSPFTLAFETAGIKVLPSIINAIVIVSKTMIYDH